MICFGHRGARGHEPENTLRSVRAAIALDADWVEVDVRAVDGELIVIHDDRLERTTDGIGPVAGRDLAYLRSLDAGAGERIPLLSEIFETVGGRVGINIEMKGAGVAEPVLEFVRAWRDAGGTNDEVLVSSFDHRQLRWLREQDADLALGALLVGLPITDAAFAEELGATAVHPSVELVDARFVDDAHRRGLKVHAFTANHPDDIARMAALGVDGVFSDYPERVAGQSTT